MLLLQRKCQNIGLINLDLSVKKVCLTLEISNHFMHKKKKKKKNDIVALYPRISHEAGLTEFWATLDRKK